MELTADAFLPFPRPIVFAAYRDRTQDLVSYLPNVLSIEVKERRDQPPVSELVNLWRGGGEIPAAARAFLSESMLTWTDYARWDESDWTCAWRVETHAFTEAVTCRGLNHFVERDGGTVVQIRGEISVDAGKIKGVPRMLAGTVSKAAQEVLASKIRPNLLGVTDAVRQLLEKA